MTDQEPFATYLELRQSTAEGEAGAGLAHVAEGLVLLHVLELASSGEPQGAVIVVHDAGSHGSRYLDLARSLAAGGWATALPDMRGSGKSEGERGHSAGLKEVVRDIEEVQNHVAYRLPDAAKVLVGHGLGAIYALAFALERPGQVQALVLSSPLLEPHFELPEPKRGLLKFMKRVGPTSPGRIGFDPQELSGDPAQLAARGADELVHDVISLRAGTQAREAALTYPARMAELAIPTLILQGGRDSIAPPELARSLVRDGVDLRLYDELRHDLFHDAGSEQVVSDLCAWLKKI